MQPKNNPHNDVKLISTPVDGKIKILPNNFVVEPECDLICHYDETVIGRLNDELELMLKNEVDKSIEELYKKINITDLNNDKHQRIDIEL